MPADPRGNNEQTLCLVLRKGRLRQLQATIMVACGLAAGWLWLDAPGAVLLGLWAWSAWPRWETASVHVRLDRLRFARLNAWRVFWVERRRPGQQVFIDELSAECYADLRRELKAAC
ncbi:MAG: hypothetical protein OES38_20640 [Gammaproteobacteria bacterium]|nr:hypothetical protein [Gammaproteobacteria bacterium]